ncbi:MAG: fasciclin domain-containing protein [Pleurocapsa minor GSE-CHR-MK-17-07R]|jgi:uncharacterized surface protein with fasciclin (FAS1) repeats/predicted SnoaL-like aldol condensation-catalyzing enzyme|nr:fasciclin domain-containing protein [Pleurocapsa minor GSE-CHR-MK 17-07R]
MKRTAVFTLASLALAFSVGAAQAQSDSVFSVISARAELSTLTAAIEAAGLQETLSDPALAVTVFAPTDAVFDELPEDAVAALLADTEALTQLLTYHVATEPLAAASISGFGQSVTTLQGESYIATTLPLGKTLVGGAEVVEGDIAAGSSIIHTIDSLLLPSALRESISSPRIRTAYNREMGRAFIQDLLNAPSFEQAQAVGAQIVAEDYIQHNPLVSQGRAGLLGFLEVMPTFFSNTVFTLKDVIADEDTVVARWVWSGTHSGTFLTYEATNNDFDMGVIDLWIVRDGQLYEHWDEIGWSYALAQLGIYQFPPEPIGPVQGYPTDN